MIQNRTKGSSAGQWLASITTDAADVRADHVQRLFDVPADLRARADAAAQLVEDGRLTKADRKVISAAARDLRVYFLGSASAYYFAVDHDPKTAKSNAKLAGTMTAICYLTPGSRSGFNLCGSASEGCLRGCLDTSGHGGFSGSVHHARLRRTLLLMTRPAWAHVVVCSDLMTIAAKAARSGLTLHVRANGTSDLALRTIVPESIQWLATGFYDYTKHTLKAHKALGTDYHVTLSRSEDNHAACLEFLAEGGTVAIVFRDGLPETFEGFPVVNGDETDGRWTDPAGHWIGLTAKGSSAEDTSGFVVDAI